MVKLLSALVENKEDIETYSTSPDLCDENELDGHSFPIAVECVIITRSAWEEAWQPLVDWNIKRGEFTEVLTLQRILDDAQVEDYLWSEGEDWLETIRNCIRWFHEMRSAQYILIGTDATAYGLGQPSYNEVPMRYCKLWREDGLPSCYTDWYYACVDSQYGSLPVDWQTNGDESWWGEYYPPGSQYENDLMDLIPDIAVGRIPVHNSDEAEYAALRSVNYQKYSFTGVEPSSDLLVVSASVYNEVVPETWEHLEEIISVVPSYIGRYWLAEQSCTIPFAEEISPDDVLDHLDGSATGGGGYYRVNFGGHGGYNYIAANPTGTVPTNTEKVFSADLRDLSEIDGNYCTGWAFNCHTGNLTHQGNNSIIETWLGTDEQSTDAPLGPAYIGNSEFAWNSWSPCGSTSHNLNRWFLNALYNLIPDEGVWGIGDTFLLAKAIYSGEYLAGYPRAIPEPFWPGAHPYYEPMWDLKTSNLGGDPALPLWLEDPMQMVSDYEDIIRCPGDFELLVTVGEDPIQGVRVCLMMKLPGQGYDIYRRGFTNSSGVYLTSLDPEFAGTMHVTLTKQGYLPDEGVVSLTIE